MSEKVSREHKRSFEKSLRLYDARRLDLERARSVFKDNQMDSFKSACGVVKVRGGRKGTAWWGEGCKGEEWVCVGSE